MDNNVHSIEEEMKIRLAKAIRESGLSQPQLAKKIGVSYSAINAYTSLKRPQLPPMDVLRKIALATGANPRYLLALEDQQKSINTILDEAASKMITRGQSLEWIPNKILNNPNVKAFMYDFTEYYFTQLLSMIMGHITDE